MVKWEKPVKSGKEALGLLEKGCKSIQFEHSYDPYSNGIIQYERSVGDKIKDTRLTDAELYELVQKLKKNTTCKALDISGQRLGAEAVGYIKELLEGNEVLEAIYLDDNLLKDEDVEYLAEAIEKNKKLKELSLSGNKIGSKGAIALARALKKNETLESLWLNRNLIRDDGAAKFGKVLKSKNKTLTSLCLEENLVRESGAKALTKALKKNDDLKTLNLGGNKIGATGAKYFDSMIDKRGKKEMPEVELILDGNRMVDDDLEVIKAKADSRHVKVPGRAVYDQKPKDKMKRRVRNYLKYHWLNPVHAGHYDPEDEVEPVL